MLTDCCCQRGNDIGNERPVKFRSSTQFLISFSAINITFTLTAPIPHKYRAVLQLHPRKHSYRKRLLRFSFLNNPRYIRPIVSRPTESERPLFTCRVRHARPPKSVTLNNLERRQETRDIVLSYGAMHISISGTCFRRDYQYDGQIDRWMDRLSNSKCHCRASLCCAAKMGYCNWRRCLQPAPWQ